LHPLAMENIPSARMAKHIDGKDGIAVMKQPLWKIARRLHAGSVSRTVIATVLARYRIA